VIGSVLGNYKVVSQISAGGMGAVYRAEHQLLGRIVAIKVLHPEMCANKDVVNRFFNEAKATTAINHPGIVEVFDFGYMPSGHAYIVMEFLDGMSLAQRIKLRKPIPEGEAAMIIRGICGALSAAHAKGIVHRDLKPDNIFVIPDPDTPLGERCKLLDFGIAKLTDIGMAGSTTKTGAVMGTPSYMSPEQCRGTGDVDHRADLYSLGCILYELICGVVPFRLKGAGEMIGAHLYATPESPTKKIPTISSEMETLVMTLLEKAPERRIQSARELGAYLAQIASHQGWSTGPETERVSLQIMTPEATGAAVLTPPSFTPLFPVTRPPLELTPLVPTPAQIAEKPTTLSSSVGQTTPTAAPAPRSRARLWIALVAGTAAIIGGIAIVGTIKHGSTAASVARPAAAPPPTPMVVTTPTPKPPEPAATPAPPPPVPVVEPPPAPPPPVVVEAHPPPAKPVKKATVKKPVTTAKPADAAKKPTDTPLLENDL
jgi:serine/threonine-protein kinase